MFAAFYELFLDFRSLYCVCVWGFSLSGLIELFGVVSRLNTKFYEGVSKVLINGIYRGSEGLMTVSSWLK